jgi:prepilin-type processing-associated H-X9-DG protein
LKQIGIAMHGYHGAMGTFPMGYVARGPFVDASTDTTPGWSWAAMILNHFEQGPLFNATNFWLDVSAAANATVATTSVSAFLCPSDTPPTGPFWAVNSVGAQLVQVAPSSYAACVGGYETAADFGFDGKGNGKGVFFRNSSIRISQIKDGTSTTALVFERCWGKGQGTWVGAVPTAQIRVGAANTAPQPPIRDVSAPTLVQAHSHYVNFDNDEDSGMDDVSSYHPNGANMLFADGSVRYERSAGPTGFTSAGEASPRLRRMAALGTRAGGEIVAPD